MLCKIQTLDRELYWSPNNYNELNVVTINTMTSLYISRFARLRFKISA